MTMAVKSPLLVPALVLVLTVCACRAWANPPIELDLRFGPAITGVGRPLRDTLDRAELSLDFGIAARWQHPSSRWGIQAEIQLARRYRSYPDTLEFLIVDGRPLVLRQLFEVGYLRSALLARASLRRGGRLRPYVLTGPYLAWRASASIPQGYSSHIDPIDPANVRAHNSGVIVGFGCDVVVADADRLSLELRFDQGLSNALTDAARLSGRFRAMTLQLAFAPFHRD